MVGGNVLAGALALVVAASSTAALAWGATGHRIIGRLAIETLPPDTPDWLRGAAVAEAVGELAREPDRWRDAGRIHDTERDPAHFVDLDDDGRILGGPLLAALPPTREAYDTALRAVGADTWKAGYLPYAIADAWQQLVKDLAYWRVDVAGARMASSGAHRDWLARDAEARRGLILGDLGTLAHYVGDGSQPLHVTTHFNGWGRGLDPGGYTQDHVHAPFEGAFVRDFVSPQAVRAAMAPAADCHCPIEQAVAGYLAATGRSVIPFYQRYKATGFEGGDAGWRAFATERLAAGAAELRDEIAMAWRASARASAGYPAVSVADVEAGRLDPYDALFGED